MQLKIILAKFIPLYFPKQRENIALLYFRCIVNIMLRGLYIFQFSYETSEGTIFIPKGLKELLYVKVSFR
jgi:hypothetical protein